MDLNMIITGVTFTERRRVSADEDSKKAGEFKLIDLSISYDGLTLKDVIAKAFDHDVIAWQITARKHYAKLVDRSSVKISAKSPGRTQIDVLAEAKVRYASMTVEEKAAYITELQGIAQ